MAARVRVRFPLIDLTGDTPDVKNAIRIMQYFGDSHSLLYYYEHYTNAVIRDHIPDFLKGTFEWFLMQFRNEHHTSKLPLNDTTILLLKHNLNVLFWLTKDCDRIKTGLRDFYKPTRAFVELFIKQTECDFSLDKIRRMYLAYRNLEKSPIAPFKQYDQCVSENNFNLLYETYKNELVNNGVIMLVDRFNNPLFKATGWIDKRVTEVLPVSLDACNYNFDVIKTYINRFWQDVSRLYSASELKSFPDICLFRVYCALDENHPLSTLKAKLRTSSVVAKT